MSMALGFRRQKGGAIVVALAVEAGEPRVLASTFLKTHLGRLRRFATCLKDKRDCLVPGCGAIPFNKRIHDFVAHDDILADAGFLYRRGSGRLRSALDLPTVEL